MKNNLKLISILPLILHFSIQMVSAQHRKLPDSLALVNNKILSLKIRHCPDLTCVNSLVCDVYNFTPNGMLKSSYTVRTPKTNNRFFTTVSDSENYKVYYYNSLNYLEEVHAKKHNSICSNLQKSTTEITRYTYRKDGKLILQSITNSCCTLRLKYDYLTNTTAKLLISEEYCTQPKRKRTQQLFYANNNLIKEVIDDKKYYLYQYDTNGKLTEIKCFNKIKSGKLITHQKFTYNSDGTLHEETVQEYYENDMDTKFIDSSYLYAYSDNLLRMITFKSFGKISEYFIYNYNP